MDINWLSLRDAVERGDIRKVTEMIEQDGSLLNARLPGNVTPLMDAVPMPPVDKMSVMSNA